jgi:hypothetical protein
VDRFEPVVQHLAEGQVSLQKLIAELATETRKGFERVAKQFKETGKRMRQWDCLRATDKHIDELVIAKRETTTSLMSASTNL